MKTYKDHRLAELQELKTRLEKLDTDFSAVIRRCTSLNPTPPAQHDDELKWIDAEMARLETKLAIIQLEEGFDAEKH